MILHPGILALLLSSGMIAFLVLTAAWFGARILRNWDLASGSSLQLGLERRTYLISTILAYAFVFQLLSFFLFIYTADSLSPLFVGAMCAAGTLQVNGYGYPVLALKAVNFLAAGLWLIVNTADNRAEDYPLIRWKYGLLMLILPLVIAEAALQTLYIINLRPDVITSCCGSLFSQASQNIGADIAALPVLPTAAAFVLACGAAVGSGTFAARRGRGAPVLAVSAALALPAGIAALIAFIGPYAYELPTHHCPFCVLQREYGYFGYFYYGALLGGSLSGMGAGMLQVFRHEAGLVKVIPEMQSTLARISLSLLSLALMMALLVVILSDLTMR